MTALIVDWSMYQSEYHGDPNNQAEKYDPARWTVGVDFAAACAVVDGVILRAGIGVAKDPCFDRYLSGVKAQGKPWGIYHAYLPGFTAVRQAALVKQWCPEDPPLGVYADLEVGADTFGPTDEYLRAVDVEYGRLTGIYSGGPYVNGHFSAAEQRHWLARPTWWAGYPDFILPAGWAGQAVTYWIHQFTDAHRLPGLAKPCDASSLHPSLTITSLMRQARAPMVPRGSLIGIHSIRPGNTVPLVKQAAVDGAPYSAVVILDDGAVCKDVVAASPSTYAVCRYYNPNDDSLQGVADWSPGQVQAWAARGLHLITSRTPDDQVAAARWFITHNEPCPNDPDQSDPDHPGHDWSEFHTGRKPYPVGWRAMALAFMELLHQAENENDQRRAAGRPLIHLGIGALSQGTPEWSEMKALYDTGLFQLMQSVGALWVVHEGVWTDQKIQDGFGDVIPGAPPNPNAGSACFRVNFLYDGFLRPAGLFVPFLVGEWYGGGRYQDPPGDHVAAMAWYDGRLAAEPEAIGFCGFTCNPNDGWKNADYTPTSASQAMRDYRVRLKDRKNGATMPDVSDADFATLVGNNAADAAILAKYKPAPVKHALAGKSNQDVVNLFDKAFGTMYIDAIVRAGLTFLYVPDSNRPLPYTGPAVEDMANLTAADKAALVASLG